MRDGHIVVAGGFMTQPGNDSFGSAFLNGDGLRACYGAASNGDGMTGYQKCQGVLYDVVVIVKS